MIICSYCSIVFYVLLYLYFVLLHPFLLPLKFVKFKIDHGSEITESQ